MKTTYKQDLFKNIPFNRILDEKYLKIYDNSFSKYYSYGMDLTMISAPLITYLFQIFKFYRTKSSKGFSKYMCLFLFLGNIFRIFFWYGTRFKNVLLYQSIGIVSFQLILIHLCIKFQEDLSNYSKLDIQNANDNQLDVENKNNINIVKNYFFAYFSKTFKPKYCKWFICAKTLNPKLFWNWVEEKEYYKFMILILLLLSSLCSFFKEKLLLFQIFGFLSAFFESLICVPQIISNCKMKVTKNISFVMISFWFFGDSFRLFYNVKYKAPLQLIIGISIQIFFDMIVLFQLILYRNNTFKDKKVNSNKKQIEEINQLMKSIDELNVAK
jgi:uncharacterized protein with PQ loop repeat